MSSKPIIYYLAMTNGDAPELLALQQEIIQNSLKYSERHKNFVYLYLPHSIHIVKTKLKNSNFDKKYILELKRSEL